MTIDIQEMFQALNLLIIPAVMWLVRMDKRLMRMEILLGMLPCKEASCDKGKP